MKTNDLENELKNLRFVHLTESELIAYCDQEPDQISRARMEAHLKHCFICERQLEMLREESEAISHRQISAEDVALVERLMEQMGSVGNPSATGPAEIVKRIPLQERVAEYLRQMVARWQFDFGQGALRGGADRGEEVWQWDSEDGHLRARAMMEKNADLTIRVSSNEMGLEGARLRLRLGLLSQELTLQRVSESEVAAQVAVPSPYRQGNMADISIEVV
jgi:hypothetical protein